MREIAIPTDSMVNFEETAALYRSIDEALSDHPGLDQMSANDVVMAVIALLLAVTKDVEDAVPDLLVNDPLYLRKMFISQTIKVLTGLDPVLVEGSNGVLTHGVSRQKAH